MMSGAEARANVLGALPTANLCADSNTLAALPALLSTLRRAGRGPRRPARPPTRGQAAACWRHCDTFPRLSRGWLGRPTTLGHQGV
jgi:hypothetical protein